MLYREGLSVVPEFREFLNHIATSIANLAGVEFSGGSCRCFCSGSSGRSRGFHNRCGRSFNRNARSKRTTGFNCGSFGGRCCRGSNFSGRSSLCSRSFGVIEFTTGTVGTTITAITTRTTVLTFVAVTVLALGLSVFTAVFFILTILVVILIVVAVTTSGHVLLRDGTARTWLEVHVGRKLFHNRSVKIVKNLVYLREDNNAQNHCDE